MYEPSEIQRFRILSRSYRSAVIDDSEGAVIAAINLATQIMAIREIYEQVLDDPCTATTTHFEFPTLQKATEKEERLAAEQVVVNTPR